MTHLRPYQLEACTAVEDVWDRYQRALIVAATGTGKTEMFVELAGRAIRGGKRAMILVDRVELLDQAVGRIRERLGVTCDIEMGAHSATDNWLNRSPVVVATVQTLRSGPDGAKRRMRFDPQEFSRLIVDEAHLSITPTTEETIRHFCTNDKCKVLGVTATPDRSDNMALGRIYERCAYRYDILDAIGDGYLVPVRGKTVRVQSLDLSVLPERKRDFTDDEVGKLMEEQGPLHEVTGTLLKEIGDRRTIVFAARVAHAQHIAAILNRERPGCARCVSGDTPKLDRREVVEAFGRGEFQFLINCAVFTTGFDSPGVQCVAIARPTKSRALFAQMCGRGTRVLPGVINGLETADERAAAIEASDKPDMLVLSFVGKAGGLDLVGPEDVLGGQYKDKVVRRAKKLADEGDDDSIEDRLEEAQREIEDEDKKRETRTPVSLQAKVKYEAKDVDLFKRGEVVDSFNRGAHVMTEGTRMVLERAKVPARIIRKLEANPREAGRAAREIIRRRHAGLCTYKQGTMLSRLGVSREAIRTTTFDQASVMIDQMKKKQAS